MQAVQRNNLGSMSFTTVSVDGHNVKVSADSPLLKTVDMINRRLEADQLDLALREIDRAWRVMPKHHRTLAPIYGRLLIKKGKNSIRAISLLVRALDDDPTPELEADLIQALSQSGQCDAAQQRMVDALRRYAVTPNSPLARRARQVVADSAGEISGWVGLTPGMQLYAEAVTTSDRARFEVLSEDEVLLDASESTTVADARVIASLNVPADKDLRLLHIKADGRTLLGGNRDMETPFGLDGRAYTKRGVISGWARLGWNPGVPLILRVRDQQGHSKQLRATELMPSSRWGFRFDTRSSRLVGGHFTISVQLPDHSWQPLPDSPLLSESRVRTSLRAITAALPPPSQGRNRAQPAESDRPPVCVIIPVYRNREQTLACIEAVGRTIGECAGPIIVVDDATPEPLLAADLTALALSGRITLLRNRSNLGFPASVNRAMALCEDHDAVLVNSDVVVFHNWLQRLRDAAYSGPRIATVTPLADDDSIVGYNLAGAGTDAVSTAETLDQFVADANWKITAELPVGVGFCLYIRRDCWREVGSFDEIVFDRGYGEESDFCMRASKMKWRHLLAADVFVHHAGSGSFGARRVALLDRSRRLLNLRHSGYDRYVSRFSSSDPLLPFRRGMDGERLSAHGGRIVLLVSLALNGGVERFVAERCRRIRAEGRVPLVLRPLKIGPDVCTLRCEELQTENLQFRIAEELPALRQLLESLPLQAIELHHFLGLDPRLIALVRQLGVPYDAYLHDYSWICPRITLIDGSGSYCGEPAVSSCERCIQHNGSELFESISVRALRRRSAGWLAKARRVLAPSADTANRFRRYMPELRIDVVPHETFMVAAPRPSSDSGTTRIALLGAIGQHKGYKVLLDCARDSGRRQLNLEFVVIGYTQDDDRLSSTGKVFITGEYTGEEISTLLQRERPHAVFLPSVWPETWSFTLSEAIRSGLPVIAFDLGAIAERLREEGIGTLLPLGLPTRAINDYLVGISN